MPSLKEEVSRPADDTFVEAEVSPDLRMLREDAQREATTTPAKKRDDLASVDLTTNKPMQVFLKEMEALGLKGEVTSERAELFSATGKKMLDVQVINGSVNVYADKSLTNEVSKALSPVLHHKSATGDLSSIFIPGADVYTAHPALTEAELKQLSAPASVERGTTIVSQAEAMVVRPGEGVETLATFGVGEGACRAVILRDPSTGITAMAHLDKDSMGDREDILVIRERMIRMGASPDAMEVKLNFENANSMVLDILKKDFQGRVENLDRFRDGESLGVAVNVKTGELHPTDAKDLSQTLVEDPGLEARMKLVELKLKHQIPFTFIEPNKAR